MVARKKVHIRLSDRAMEKLADIGKARKLDRPSAILEALIDEAHGTPADYYARQSAFQGFATMAMTAELLRMAYNGDRSEAQHFREVVAAHARTLFGPPPTRPEGVQGEGELDPRIHALLEAYGVFG